MQGVGSKRPATNDGWQCQRCNGSGCENNPEEETRCVNCGEARFRRHSLLSIASQGSDGSVFGAAHFGRQGSSSSSISSTEESSQGSTRCLLSEAMQTPTAGAFNATVESDLAEVRKLSFDEGCVSMKRRIGHTGTQHLISFVSVRSRKKGRRRCRGRRVKPGIF